MPEGYITHITTEFSREFSQTIKCERYPFPPVEEPYRGLLIDNFNLDGFINKLNDLGFKEYGKYKKIKGYDKDGKEELIGLHSKVYSGKTLGYLLKFDGSSDSLNITLDFINSENTTSDYKKYFFDEINCKIDYKGQEFTDSYLTVNQVIELINNYLEELEPRLKEQELSKESIKA